MCIVSKVRHPFVSIQIGLAVVVMRSCLRCWSILWTSCHQTTPKLHPHIPLTMHCTSVHTQVHLAWRSNSHFVCMCLSNWMWSVAGHTTDFARPCFCVSVSANVRRFWNSVHHWSWWSLNTTSDLVNYTGHGRPKGPTCTSIQIIPPERVWGVSPLSPLWATSTTPI